MKKVVVALFFLSAIYACSNGKKTPDVSNIKVDLQVQRFEQDFFRIDTNNLDVSLQQLHEKYPEFMQVFVFQILSGQSNIDTLQHDVKAFIRSYKPLYDSTLQAFGSIDDEVRSLKKGLQFTKYYFPKYRLPNKFVTFLAPLDAYFLLSDNSISGSMKIENVLGAGLHLYMGRDFSVYKNSAFQEHYPGFISRRFSKEYIPVNSIKLIIDDMYPLNSRGRSLVEQMVEAGKRLYVLDKLLPGEADTLKTGYTKAQLDGAYANETNIWSFFLSSNALFSTDPAVIKDYMNDAPNTTALGPASPGFIGQFVGWQIVKKWMDKKERTLDELMRTPAKQIFEEAKYKPA